MSYHAAQLCEICLLVFAGRWQPGTPDKIPDGILPFYGDWWTREASEGLVRSTIQHIRDNRDSCYICLLIGQTLLHRYDLTDDNIIVWIWPEPQIVGPSAFFETTEHVPWPHIMLQVHARTTWVRLMLHRIPGMLEVTPPGAVV
jgi:hypothetical protein